MDVVERLSLESASQHSSEACEHIHRYELASALCRGVRVLDLACGSGYGSDILTVNAASVHGVDRDVASVDLAAATIGQRTGATFEAADAVAYLDRDLTSDFDAIVCFEGLEHLPTLDRVITRLRKHVNAGMSMVVSVPNSKAFEEQNPFHVTDFGYEEAVDLLEKLSGDAMLFQYLTEGSLISATGDTDRPPRTSLHLDGAEPEYANHFILIANLDSKQVLAAQGARSLFVEAPIHNRYAHGLDVANNELRRRNNELARKMIGNWPTGLSKAGSAAPSFVVSLERQIADLEASVEREIARGEQEAARRDEKIAKLEGVIAQRDDMVLAQRSELLQLRQDLIAGISR